jgi:hypothetical protein
MAVVDCASAGAKPGFTSSDLGGRGSEIVFCDLDGDGLEDVVLVDGIVLSIFYQDPKRGFTREPQLEFPLENKPAVLWTARLGKKAESLLLMTSEGVTELSCTNRTGPPIQSQIIKQETIVPGALDETRVMCLPLSADTGGDWPLLLAPAAGGLQVWQHRQAWRQAQLIEHTLDRRIRPAVTNPGYATWTGLSMSLGDINGDRRDDLVVMRSPVSGVQIYAVYLQKPEGLLAAEPALTYTHDGDWRTWLCWVDINRDGNVDLIKNKWLNDPSFIPGTRSGKVLVGVSFADEQGRIPAEPQQVFRKNDWTPALPVVDVDGDGFVDLVLGYSQFDSREGMRKMITAKQLDFTLKFHFYRSPAGFPSEPDCQRDVVIHLNRHALHLSWSRRQFFKRFVSLEGDFNGDAKRDLLVRDHGDHISVCFFVSRNKGFNQDADLQFHCPEPIDSMQVRDLNGDGISDLVVKLEKENGFRIFTSHGK